MVTQWMIERNFMKQMGREMERETNCVIMPLFDHKYKIPESTIFKIPMNDWKETILTRMAEGNLANLKFSNIYAPIRVGGYKLRAGLDI